MFVYLPNIIFIVVSYKFWYLGHGHDQVPPWYDNANNK